MLLGNEADAEDVSGQVFLQVVRKLDSFRGKSAFSTWLNRVAVNAALAYRKQRGTRRRRELPEVVEEFAADGRHLRPVRPVIGPLPEILARETHELIDSAILRLPERYRDVFVLADVEERTNQEIADLLGLSLAAVKSRLHRARLMMRKELAPYFEEKAA
jgi:RNA polymerase sigma-70 factor (ECF subfamily)